MSDPLLPKAPPDITAVDDLCRLVLVARRLGCTVTLSGVSDELLTMLDLAGVADHVVGTHSEDRCNDGHDPLGRRLRDQCLGDHGVDHDDHHDRTGSDRPDLDPREHVTETDLP